MRSDCNLSELKAQGSLHLAYCRKQRADMSLSLLLDCQQADTQEASRIHSMLLLPAGELS